MEKLYLIRRNTLNKSAKCIYRYIRYKSFNFGKNIKTRFFNTINSNKNSKFIR